MSLCRKHEKKNQEIDGNSHCEKGIRDNLEHLLILIPQKLENVGSQVGWFGYEFFFLNPGIIDFNHSPSVLTFILPIFIFFILFP